MKNELGAEIPKREREHLFVRTMVVVVVSANGALHVVIKFVCLFLKAVAGSYAGRVDAEKHRGRRLSCGDGALAGVGPWQAENLRCSVS